MRYRRLGKTDFQVSEISLGTWQVGGRWGSAFDQSNAEKLLHQAIDEGINFIDTADVYEGGRSESAVGKVVNSRTEKVYVATKCGGKVRPKTHTGYTPEVLRGYVEDSLRNLKTDRIDLIQLHCPPSEVYYMPEIFELFDRLKEEGKILHLGVSVEKVEEAIKASNYSNVATVQIIFNMFRQRPASDFFPIAAQKDIGVIVRVPLASGLLTGTYTTNTEFAAGDHRHFNREGSAFDKGETFSGIPYDIGLRAVEELKALFPGFKNLAPVALRWILDWDEVGCVIPGASRTEQLMTNITAASLPAIVPEKLQAIQAIYNKYIRQYAHEQW